MLFYKVHYLGQNKYNDAIRGRYVNVCLITIKTIKNDKELQMRPALTRITYIPIMF